MLCRGDCLSLLGDGAGRNWLQLGESCRSLVPCFHPSIHPSFLPCLRFAASFPVETLEDLTASVPPGHIITVIPDPSSYQASSGRAGGLSCLGTTRAHNRSALRRVAQRALVRLSVGVSISQSSRQGIRKDVLKKAVYQSMKIGNRTYLSFQKNCPNNPERPSKPHSCSHRDRFRTSPRCQSRASFPSSSRTRQLSSMRRRISTSQVAIGDIRGSVPLHQHCPVRGTIAGSFADQLEAPERPKRPGEDRRRETGGRAGKRARRQTSGCYGWR